MNIHINRLKVCYLLFVILLAVTSLKVAADEHTAKKADFLYRAALYVNWPDSEEPLVFCTIGGNPFGQMLSSVIKDKKIKGRSLQAKYIASRSQASSCHVLFVNKSLEKSADNIVSSLKGVLTVSDVDDFAEKKGGIIQFVILEGKVRLYINRRAASKAGLKLGSQLLNLAKKIF